MKKLRKRFKKRREKFKKFLGQHEISSEIYSLFRMANLMSSITEEFIFFLLIGCSSMLAFDLLDLYSHTVISVDSMVAIYDLFAVLTLAFLACYLSEMLTTVFMEADNIFYNCAWYEWPMTRQRNLIMAIRQTHDEFRLKSFGYSICSVSMFLKVNIFDGLDISRYNFCQTNFFIARRNLCHWSLDNPSDLFVFSCHSRP